MKTAQMIPWYCSQQVSLFPQSAILSFEVIISFKRKLSVCRSSYREDYWRYKKKEGPFCPYFWLNNSQFTTENKVGKCRLYCPIFSLLVFSNCDRERFTSLSLHGNFPFNLPQTCPTLSSHMLYIPSAPSWRLNRLQNPFPFPTSAKLTRLRSSLPLPDNSSHPQEAGNPSSHRQPPPQTHKIPASPPHWLSLKQWGTAGKGISHKGSEVII